MKVLTHIALTIALLLAAAGTAAADSHLAFTLHKLESPIPGNTLLVVGGIQGDEPGGFNAAALLVTHYTIQKGAVWVVPNLNFVSIINRTRGVYGDMNRKFASIEQDDPEFAAINKIKQIILDDRIGLIVNLHDGSGFYRPEYIDRRHNPNRWGQCVIIDQDQIDAERYGNLGAVAWYIATEANYHLLSDEHIYHVKNTHTRLGNKEMEKTLSYFAVRNNKPAFGLEVSKDFPTHTRVYYHLRMLESYMDMMGIEYERSFAMTPQGVNQAINSNIQVVLYDNKILLDMQDARNHLRFMPLKKNADLSFTPSNPLLTIVNRGKNYRVYHGNRRLTWIQPQYFEYDSGIDGITMEIDGQLRDVQFGGMVVVGDSFEVLSKDGYRINVIGFKKPGVQNESGIPICKNDIPNRFSIDKAGNVYRVEVYQQNKFTGMVLVNFDEQPAELKHFESSTLSMAEPLPFTKSR
jgi:hypothetical protein